MERINPADLPKFRRLMILDMKIFTPRPLTDEERKERTLLTDEFNLKHPLWQKKRVNFITGEIKECLNIL